MVNGLSRSTSSNGITYIRPSKIKLYIKYLSYTDYWQLLLKQLLNQYDTNMIKKEKVVSFDRWNTGNTSIKSLQKLTFFRSYEKNPIILKDVDLSCRHAAVVYLTGAVVWNEILCEIKDNVKDFTNLN